MAVVKAISFLEPALLYEPQLASAVELGSIVSSVTAIPAVLLISF